MNAIEATDQLFTLIKTFTDSQSLSVQWPDVVFEKPPVDSYARVALKHATGVQAALSMGSAGGRLWESGGVVSVTFFVPIAQGLTVGYTLAQGMQAAVRSSNLAVWSRNVRIRELGSEGGYQQVQVLWDFEYRDQQ